MPTNRPDPFPTTAWLAPPAARALAILAAMPPSRPRQARKRRAERKTRLIGTAIITAALGLVLGGPAAIATAPTEEQRDRVKGTVRTVAAQPSPAFVLARKLERDFAQQQAEATGINPYSGRPYRSRATASQPSAADEEHRKMERDQASP
jgi:hypothetical protein